MVNTTENLTNVNLLSREQYDSVTSPSAEELWAVETPSIIEKFKDNNGNWYRIYSDGWIEQGGLYVGNNNQSGTLTLLKPYDNLDYIINLQHNRNGAATANAAMIYGKTTSTITFQNWATDGTRGGMWYACGQGE